MFDDIREAFKGISGVFVIVFVLCTLIGLGYLNGAYYEHRKSEATISQLKSDLQDAKEQIKLLEENQSIIYYTDSWGGNYDY
ncbi:hypothetical protein QP805_04300 [Streptococcus pasteurianus]|uniref:hypothetical protein n=1 Tax=Streptococcus pasteurianus TaxID=197614 RepID=UPI002556ED4A|nr:hypothetical protein [Streptococcus pasteurianus]MDK8393928.1 hypothetical protein [Streptococcus pasteurianus]